MSVADEQLAAGPKGRAGGIGDLGGRYVGQWGCGAISRSDVESEDRLPIGRVASRRGLGRNELEVLGEGRAIGASEQDGQREEPHASIL